MLYKQTRNRTLLHRKRKKMFLMNAGSRNFNDPPKKNVEESTVFIPFNPFTLSSHCESEMPFSICNLGIKRCG